MNIRNLFIFQLLFVVVFSFFVIRIPAVFAEGIKITPNRIEAVIDPGETIQKSIKIYNNSNQERILYLALKDFKTKGNVGQVEISKGESMLDSWIDMPGSGIKFAPHEEKKISFTINVPENAGPGGHYGAILIGGSPQDGSVSSSGDKGAIVSINHQITSLLLFHVTGDVVESANVKEFSVDKFFYNTPAEVNFLSKIENIGNVHVKPRGMIQIKNMAGEKVDTIIVNKTGGNVLPSNIREFSNVWNKKFAFGKYTAELILTYGISASDGGSGQKTLSFVTSFWIFPVKIMIPLIGGIVVAVFLFFLFFKFQENKAVKRTLHQMGVSNNSTRIKGREYSSAKHFFSIFLFFSSVVLFISLVIYFLFFS